jgi:hypothetical protein
MARRYHSSALTAIHDLAHLLGLSTERDLWLNVSERTLYLLHNFAASDIGNWRRYATEFQHEHYTPVRPSDAEFDLFQDVRDAAELELVEVDPMHTGTLTDVYKWASGGTLESGVWTEVPYTGGGRDALDEWQELGGYAFLPAYDGLRLFSASFYLVSSTAWDDRGEELTLALYEDGGDPLKFLERKQIYFAGEALSAFITGSAIVYLEEGQKVRLYGHQTSEATQQIMGPPLIVQALNYLNIVGLPD